MNEGEEKEEDEEKNKKNDDENSMCWGYRVFFFNYFCFCSDYLIYLSV